MNKEQLIKREFSFGTSGLTILDKFGVWLSKCAIVKATNGKRNLEILELGCGFSARNLVALDGIAISLTGVDFNLSEQIKGWNKFIPIENSIEGALEDLSSNKYDLIMIISVLEHLNNPLQVLKKCKKMLNDEGVLIINVPTWLGKIFLEFSAFKLALSPKEEMDDHKMYYDKRDLWPLLVKAGFLPSDIKLNYHKFRLNLFAVSKN